MAWTTPGAQQTRYLKTWGGTPTAQSATKKAPAPAPTPWASTPGGMAAILAKSQERLQHMAAPTGYPQAVVQGWGGGGVGTPGLYQPIVPTAVAPSPQVMEQQYQPLSFGQLEPIQQAMLQQLLGDIQNPQGIAPQLQETMMRPVEASAQEEARRSGQALDEALAGRGMMGSGERVGGYTDIEQQRMNQIVSARGQLAEMSAQMQEGRRQQALGMIPGVVEGERGYGLQQQAMALNYMAENFKQQMGAAEVSLAQQARDQGWDELELKRQLAVQGLSQEEADRTLKYFQLQQQYDQLLSQEQLGYAGLDLQRWMTEQGVGREESQNWLDQLIGLGTIAATIW